MSRNIVYYIIFPVHVGEIQAGMGRFYCQNIDFLLPICSFRPKPYLKMATRNFLFDKRLRLFKRITFWKGLRFLRYCFFTILKNGKTPKTVKKILRFLLGDLITFISNIHLCWMCENFLCFWLAVIAQLFF